MFKLSELIYKTNVVKIPALQFFPIAFKKRFKNTDTSSEDVTNPEIDLSRLKKHCLMMSYLGSKYSGIQYNTGINTIEGALLRAMLESKWITYDAFKQPGKIQFKYGSRTDKGVSAVKHCSSILLPTGLNLDDINNALPDDIRVFGLKRVPYNFNARHFCDSRTYTYTLPTIAFCHYNDQSSQVKYRLSADKLKSVNELLQVYKGRRNYHNFTVHKTYSDRSSYRDILNMECEAPFVVDDVEFCTIRLRGRSFMMHQIRKMLGLMLAVVREVTDRSIYDMVFTNRIINCPMAPGLGLVLNHLHYDVYDQKRGDSGYEKLTWEECEDDVQQFFEQQIKPNIVGTEIRDEEMLTWLEALLNYPYIPEENDNEFSHKGYP